MNVIERLKNLYAGGNKHDNYQNLPAFVQDELGFNVVIDENWRGDTARYDFFLKELNFNPNETVIDVGANTGFFSLSLANKYPQTKFIAFELNNLHVNFIREIATYFKMANMTAERLSVDFEGVQKIVNCDCILHFNVLHHAGVDFDKGMIKDLDDYFEYAVKYLTVLSEKSNKMVFQMGYNWGGNKLQPIVALQDDVEKLLYSLRLFKTAGWEIKEIAHCNRINNILGYYKMPADILNGLLQSTSNLSKKPTEDLVNYVASKNPAELSEFYRRPIFILETK